MDLPPSTYRLIAESAHDLIVHAAGDGTLRYLSPGSQTLLDQPPEVLLGSDFFALIHPEDVAAVRQSHAAAGQASNAMASYRCRKRDGSWIWLEANVRRLPDWPEGEVLVVARDITQRRLIEEQLLQAQKMAGIGRLASGVAHDFNNLLSIITSAAAILQEELGADHPSQSMTQEIREACRRAAELTRQLLAFSRRQMLIPTSVNLNDLVLRVVETTKRLAGGKIKITPGLDENLGSVHADPMQIENVILNLATNAIEAMPNGGELSFRTSNLSIAANDLDAALGTPIGDYVMLVLEDTGQGMDALTRAQLFEPFFSTKARGKGVGMGLATAYGVVKQSSGQIRVRSVPGQGSAFSLLFPRLHSRAVAPRAPVPDPVAAAVPTAAAGTQTIFLVEDDDSVRRVAAALLKKKGYRVVQSANGEQALAAAALEDTPVQLLLTDVMMPGMSGPELALALKQRWPTLRVLFMSGYADDAVLRAGVQSASVNFLHKPFTVESLSRRVREVLDQSPQPT